MNLNCTFSHLALALWPFAGDSVSPCLELPQLQIVAALSSFLLTAAVAKLLNELFNLNPSPSSAVFHLALFPGMAIPLVRDAVTSNASFRLRSLTFLAIVVTLALSTFATLFYQTTIAVFRIRDVNLATLDSQSFQPHVEGLNENVFSTKNVSEINAMIRSEHPVLEKEVLFDYSPANIPLVPNPKITTANFDRIQFQFSGKPTDFLESCNQPGIPITYNVFQHILQRNSWKSSSQHTLYQPLPTYCPPNSIPTFRNPYFLCNNTCSIIRSTTLLEYTSNGVGYGVSIAPTYRTLVISNDSLVQLYDLLSIGMATAGLYSKRDTSSLIGKLTPLEQAASPEGVSIYYSPNAGIIRRQQIKQSSSKLIYEKTKFTPLLGETFSTILNEMQTLGLLLASENNNSTNASKLSFCELYIDNSTVPVSNPLNAVEKVITDQRSKLTLQSLMDLTNPANSTIILQCQYGFANYLDALFLLLRVRTDRSAVYGGTEFLYHHDYIRLDVRDYKLETGVLKTGNTIVPSQVMYHDGLVQSLIDIPGLLVAVHGTTDSPNNIAKNVLQGFLPLNSTMKVTTAPTVDAVRALPVSIVLIIVILFQIFCYILPLIFSRRLVELNSTPLADKPVVYRFMKHGFTMRDMRKSGASEKPLICREDENIKLKWRKRADDESDDDEVVGFYVNEGLLSKN